MRFALGGLVVLAAALIRRQSLRVERHERGALLGLGLLFSAQLAFTNIGQDHTSAGHAAVLMSAYPLWTAVFAHFFVAGDTLTVKRSLGALVAYAGVVVVFSGSLGSDESGTLLGDGLLVVSSLLLGARQIVLSRSAQGIAIEKLLLSQAVVGGVSFVVASVLFEPEPTQYTSRLAIALVYHRRLCLLATDVASQTLPPVPGDDGVSHPTAFRGGAQLRRSRRAHRPRALPGSATRGDRLLLRPASRVNSYNDP